MIGDVHREVNCWSAQDEVKKALEKHSKAT